MPIVFIDNQKIEAQQGETVIHAAIRNGINIPHFCWHPEMSVAGNCRMCLVEVGTPKRNPDGSFALDENNEKIINYMPKLQIACNTIVSDEMRINTKKQKVINAQAAVMEFLLINHPLDCPICDEAGQCKLQEYSTCYSNSGSRFNEVKNTNPKRVEWNDKIIYDAERCISCSRCIRFTRDIVKEDVLTFINRGDKVRIHRFDDTKLKNDYSMNIIDTCPVGALTSRDFRFKARVWEMSFNNSICTECSRGCNIKIGVKNNKVLRVEPRPNLYVNKYWMCDHGRLEQPQIINDNRLNFSKIKSNSTSQTATIQEAVLETRNIIKKCQPNETFIIASSLSSNETNYLLLELTNKIFKTKNIGYIPRTDMNFGDDFLKKNEKAPNTNGVEALNIPPINVSDLLVKINSGLIKNLLIVEEDAAYCNELIDALYKLQYLIVCSAYENKMTQIADVAFAVTTPAEYEGTFINCENRVQHFVPAIATDPTDVINFNLHQSKLDIFGAANDRWNQKTERNIKSAWFVINELLKKNETSCNYKNVESVFNDITNDYKAFNGMSYELIDRHQGLILNKANSPDPIINNYYSNVMRP